MIRFKNVINRVENLSCLCLDRW